MFRGDLLLLLVCVVGGSRACCGGAMTSSLTHPRLNLFPSTSETLVTPWWSTARALPNWQRVLPTHHTIFRYKVSRFLCPFRLHANGVFPLSLPSFPSTFFFSKLIFTLFCSSDRHLLELRSTGCPGIGNYKRYRIFRGISHMSNMVALQTLGLLEGWMFWR